MVNRLNSNNLRDYFCGRVNSPRVQMSLLALERKETGSIQLINPKGDELIINISYTRNHKKNKPDEIGLLITPGSIHQGGVSEQDVINFLEKWVKGDTLFKKGGAFYNPRNPNENLKNFQRILKRAPLEGNKMLCYVLDNKPEGERIESIVYSYMFRPCLYYSIHMGEFNQPSKQ